MKRAVRRIILILCCIGFILYSSTAAVALDADTSVFYYSQTSYTCEEAASFGLGTPDLCSKLCPNREVVMLEAGSSGFAYYCALRVCPADKPLRDKYGSCYACNENAPIFEIENCTVCPNRYEQQGECLLKADIGTTDSKANIRSEGQAAEENVFVDEGMPCPFDRPLRRYDNACLKCDVEEEVSLDSICNFENNCEAACPNRAIIRGIGGSPSSVLKCPLERPLIDSVGMCLSCDEESDIDVEYNEQNCERYCAGKRYLFLSKCIMCPANRQSLSYDACVQCNGIYKDGRCF